MRFLSHVTRKTMGARRVLAQDKITTQPEKTNAIAARGIMETFVDRRVVPVMEK
jgi:hypothetical protein